ncbi:MAG TPA: hypothetical protein VGQ83_01540 [Polyangia bacterium]
MIELDEADAALAGAELVAAAEASITDAKRIVERCLAADVPARVGRGPSCASGGCTPKAQVLVRREDVGRVRALLEREWLEAAQREGTLDPELLAKLRAAPAGDDPPCPACGTAAPLVNGACSDCGLQLA